MLYFSDPFASSLESTFAKAMDDARYPVRFASAAFVQAFGRPLSDAIYVAGDLLAGLRDLDDIDLTVTNTPSCRC